MGCASPSILAGWALVTAFVASGLAACSGNDTEARANDASSSFFERDAGQTSSHNPLALGGQSGGEDYGNSLSFEPCACEIPTARGRVLELGSCARVEVLETTGMYPEIAPGEVLGGVLSLACYGSEPLAVGDEIFFDFVPGDDQRCPERDACWATCAGAPPECSTQCVHETAEVCADDLAFSHQTGRFAAVSAEGELASFRFAGEVRTASVEDLLVPSCWEEHQRILEDYESALRESMPPVDESMYTPPAPELAPEPPPEEDPFGCYRGQ